MLHLEIKRKEKEAFIEVLISRADSGNTVLIAVTFSVKKKSLIKVINLGKNVDVCSTKGRIVAVPVPQEEDVKVVDPAVND